MKILTITIPCYNSAAYMNRAIDSLLPGGEDVEIIVVDDGSSDDTYKIGCEYAEKYPTIVRCIHKENGGHGSAVNTGLANATGIYFKVVDSDDWVKESSLMKILDVLRDMIRHGTGLDMLISNYVYEKVGEKHKKVMKYTSALPTERIFTWDEVGHFKTGRFLLMHSVIYRTQLLHESGLKLPEHCFYVDNIYVYQPLPYVRTIYYLDENFYRYFIGRDDQSVSEKNMIKRIDQQLLVNYTMIDLYDLAKIKNKRLRSYMTKYLGIMMMISSVFLIKSEDPDKEKKRADLWEYLKKNNKRAYNIIGVESAGIPARWKTSGGQEVVKLGYIIANRIFKFN